MKLRAVRIVSYYLGNSRGRGGSLLKKHGTQVKACGYPIKTEFLFFDVASPFRVRQYFYHDPFLVDERRRHGQEG
jgi:hypothetical protein